MNKLYDIQFPNEELCNIADMYFSGEHVTWEHEKLYIHQYGDVVFDTYYNAFSVEKWHKYTDMTSLFFHASISGKCRVTIYNKVMQAGDFLVRVVKHIELADKTDFCLDLSECLNLHGLIAIGIESFVDELLVSNMYYGTEDTGRNIKLAVGICTFKREQYIHKFIENFSKFESHIPNIEVFVADNAQNLKQANNPKVHIFKNKNYGGAGGFGRCMYEVRKANIADNGGFTHIVLMDDDIFIDFQIFEKMIAFLSFLKFDYRLHFLAGAMCSLDMPWLQYEKCGEYNGINLRSFGANFDLRNKDVVILNERDEKLGTSSAGWWCSCFSTDMLTPNNFPFPCFFRGDDIEFTLRNQSKIITLNGINVWHEPFYKKYSISAESYYLMRNLLVINALYFPYLSWKQSTTMLRHRFANAIFTYDYESAELLIQSISDFAKGISFYLSDNYNPEQFNTKITKKNHKLKPIDDLLEQYRIDDINYHVYQKTDRNRLHRFLRRILLNGYLLPRFLVTQFSFSHIGFGARLVSFWRARRVMVFDPFLRQGYFVEMRKWKAFCLCMKFILVYEKTKRRYKKIKEDYQCNFWRLQTESWWKKFLGID